MAGIKDYNISTDDLEDMLLYAFRYSLGSQTFSSSTMASIIKNNLKVLSERQIVVIKRDICDYFSRLKTFNENLQIITNGEMVVISNPEELKFYEKTWYDLINDIYDYEKSKECVQG